MKKLFVVLFCALMMSAPSFADEVSYEIDPAATAKAPWKGGQTIIEKGNCGKTEYYRKFLGITPSGLVVVQDFYLNGKKLSNPFLTSVKEAKDVAYSSCPKVIEGIYTKWYENGQKWEESFSKNGELEGLWAEWYENGQKMCERNYKNGKLEGTWTEWHENGQKWAESFFKNGELEGIFTWWNKNGQKDMEMNFKNGKLEGTWTEWHENGQKEFEINYKNGKEFGIWRLWDEQGNLIIEKDYGTPTD